MDGQVVKMINQPLLPHKFEIADFKDHKATAEAIKTMVVRGAGAIGATAGYGMAQAFLEAPNGDGFNDFISKAAGTMRNTRPTAQNLFYAIDRVLQAAENESSVEAKRKAAVSEAQAIADEDAESAKRIGEIGQELIKDGCNVSTHCNAGWLAFVDWGSALSPIYAAKRNSKNVFVYVDETRPRCQGSRLTAWELVNEGVPHAVIADNATGHYMKAGKIDLVIVGADRIAANGDVANKIGTYSSAVLAKENGIPFYVAAPTSTIDLKTRSGAGIPIEERGQEEVTHMFGMAEDGSHGRIRITPEQASAKNPAFDVTPAKYIAGIITEKGIVKASDEGITTLFKK
jgi:methylthioribose-1-phosphate isomerase